MNRNPITGIRYGIISANSLSPDVVDYIQSNGTDIRWQWAIDEIKQELLGLHLTPADYSALLSTRINELANEWEDNEPVHEFLIDNVSGRTTWLGGAMLVWIFNSPFTASAKLCSPCVPDCGDLDKRDPWGYECYDVPKDWRHHWGWDWDWQGQRQRQG